MARRIQMSFLQRTCCARAPHLHFSSFRCVFGGGTPSSRTSARVLKAAQREGFSLVELLAAMLAASILAITAGTMLFHAYSAWNDNHNAVNVHRDGRNAMDMMTRAIRAASASNVVTAVNRDLVLSGVALYDQATTNTVRFRRSGTDLIYDPDTGVNGNNVVLIAGGVLRFNVDSTASAITIRLDLDRDGEAMRLDSVTAFRN
jgi:prepilin-type N-terminal cleavage/methylation domain-containing protein